jgi:hypothetical protein
MSLSCAQKKFLLFLHQLDGKESIALIGNSVSLVRMGEVYSSVVNDSGFKERLNEIKDQKGALGILVDETVGRYLDSHVIRISLPAWIRAELDGFAETTNVLDFGLGNIPADEGKERTNNQKARCIALGVTTIQNTCIKFKDVGGGDNIKMDLREIGWDGMDWIDVAQDRDQWKALVNTVMNLRVP